MSLFIPGAQRRQALALMNAVVLIATTLFFSAPRASAGDAVVSVSPGETSCYYMQRTVLNPTDLWVAAMSYEIRNDVREDYPEVVLIPPRGEHNFKTDQKHYFKHELGVQTVTLSNGPGSLPVGEWQDWEAASYVLSPDCPQMSAPPTIWKRTAEMTRYRRPTIWVDVNAYRSDIGYRVGTQKRIRWVNRELDAGPKALHGPVMETGRHTVRVYVRYVDDNDTVHGPELVDTLRIKRRR